MKGKEEGRQVRENARINGEGGQARTSYKTVW